MSDPNRVSPPSSEYLEARLERLATLADFDHGFFVLAVHSLIEGYLRETFDPDDYQSHEILSTFIDRYREMKDPEGRYLRRGCDCLSTICIQHDLTNAVRHRFKSLTPMDSISAIENLYNFLALEKRTSSLALAKLRSSRDSLQDSRSKADLLKEIALIGYKANSAEKSLSSIMTEVEALRTERSESAALEAKILAYDAEIIKLKATNQELDSRYDSVRKERFEAESMLRSLTKEIESKRDAEDYLSRQRRLLGLSRSRKEYERFILKLTTEQREILDRIKLGSDADFLVKGPAGTGKTLVLIKAIEKARGSDKLELETGDGETVLLTFTRTLVKYDEYLSRIASEGKGAHRIQTADSFFDSILNLVDGRYRVDYDNNTKYAADLAKRYNTSSLEADDFASELERFIYAGNITKKEYLEDGIERKGMRKSLSKEDRLPVWASLEAIEKEMEQSGLLLKGYATKRMLQELPSLKARSDFPKIDYIFIDEVQDLSAAELMILKNCSRKCLIMAGDEDQAIYRPGFSFSRAGINIVGRSRSLGRNFRNSYPILQLAERFRATITGRDPEYEPDSDRPGDDPELFVSADREALYSMLLRRIEYFLREHQYEAENLFVIAPRNDDIAAIKTRLVAAGHMVKEPRDSDFDFSENGIIRVTTMHSAKGLDAPVVFLFLPTLPFIGFGLDSTTSDKIHRDLLYVAITRAMDHIDIFINPDSKHAALKDLAAFFPESNSDFAKATLSARGVKKGKKS